MKLPLIMVVALLASLPVSVRSEDYTVYSEDISCRQAWIKMRPLEKAQWLQGYLSAISFQGGFGDALTLPELKQEEKAVAMLGLTERDDKKRIGQILRDLRDSMWPRGHKIGSVALEMDVFCNKPENGEKTLLVALLTITKEITER